MRLPKSGETLRGKSPKRKGMFLLNFERMQYKSVAERLRNVDYDIILIEIVFWRLESDNKKHIAIPTSR